MCRDSFDHFTRCRVQLGSDPCIAVGLWADSVPCTFDKSQSIDVTAYFLPGLMGRNAEMRIPFTGLNKRYFTADHGTIDDFMSIFSWSMRALFEGIFPTVDHLGQPLHGRRKKMGGKSLGVRGILVEVRGDWSYFKSAFRLPQHNQTSGLCWLCSATPVDIRTPGSHAHWRQQRMSHFACLQRMQSEGNSISPIFSIPFLRLLLYHMS